MKNIFSLKTSRARMALLFIVDILTIIFDSYLALIIRFKIDYSWVPEEYMSSVDSYVVINVVTTLVIFLLLNLYNRVWSYASMHEAVLIVGASLLSTASVSYTHLDVYKRQIRGLSIYSLKMMNTITM